MEAMTLMMVAGGGVVMASSIALGMTPLVWESAMVPLYEEYIDVCCSMYFDGGSSQGVTVDGLRGYFK